MILEIKWNQSANKWPQNFFFIPDTEQKTCNKDTWSFFSRSCYIPSLGLALAVISPTKKQNLQTIFNSFLFFTVPESSFCGAGFCWCYYFVWWFFPQRLKLSPFFYITSTSHLSVQDLMITHLDSCGLFYLVLWFPKTETLRLPLYGFRT